MRFLVVSGLSGAGKSIAIQALEDLDYYCVDNLPVSLLPEFARQMKGPVEKGSLSNIAVGIDARNMAADLENFTKALAEVKAMGIVTEVIFVNANDQVILKRFSETRRRHPLTAKKIPLIEAIAAERQLLGPIAEAADLQLDTTNTNVHQLRRLVRERVAKKKVAAVSLSFTSFGYKFGLPTDADFVFDVRCLPNPHWEPQLQPLTGRDDSVKAFLQAQKSVSEMIAAITRFLEDWITRFEEEDRSYISVAIGCTGGKHRSVYIADILAEHFRKVRDNVLIRHRELP